MNNRFDRIEAHLRAIFEKNLPKIFTGRQPQVTLVDELIQVMRANEREDPAGRILAPDLFKLTVYPGDIIEWQMHQDILDEISNTLHRIGMQEGLSFTKTPKIELHSNQKLDPSIFEISAFYSPLDPDLPDTAIMPQQEGDGLEAEVPENAMLIIAGKTIFPLEKAVIDIGRHSTNHLVLDDPQVSRHHAQLRAIKNHYVIFDVGSTGGLFLNGRRISQATLHAGDVIRMGSVNLIFNQEPTSTHETSVIPIENDDNIRGEGQR
ncbi:MAG: DUF3662 domain-containing protein [Brevefilum sp.]|nr:DUF3662 domain-containing protein [Brevefilum sp.]